MIVDLVDGTYELFRHFHGLRRFTKGEDRPFGAVAGVLNGVLQMMENRVTDARLFEDVETLRWRGPTDLFAAGTGRIGEPRLLQRARALRELRAQSS